LIFRFLAFSTPLGKPIIFQLRRLCRFRRFQNANAADETSVPATLLATPPPLVLTNVLEDDRRAKKRQPHRRVLARPRPSDG